MIYTGWLFDPSSGKFRREKEADECRVRYRTACFEGSYREAKMGEWVDQLSLREGFTLHSITPIAGVNRIPEYAPLLVTMERKETI